MPEEKIERDPWLKRMFLGYAFSIDYRDRRGHAYMLADQEATERLTKPQSGSCLHCHASVMPLYKSSVTATRFAGLDETYKFTYQELNKLLHDSGHAHPVSCVGLPRSQDHGAARDPPGLHQGHSGLAASDAPVPAIPSIESGARATAQEALRPQSWTRSRNEMRSFVCGQCHVEYYCSTKMPLTFPWGKGLSVEQIEAFWDERSSPTAAAFVDYTHKETGAPVLKAQHPEFELWSQGIHARSGVSCADCHMPYMREGRQQGQRPLGPQPAAQRQPRLPDLPPRLRAGDQVARVDTHPGSNHALMQRGGTAIVA
jgi:nitrite reductase (cytochrome c-552)